MDNTDSKLVRPGDPRVPCFAILVRKTSELKLVNLKGGSGSSVKISDHWSLGIVTIGGEVYAVTAKAILKLRSDGKTEHLSALPWLDMSSSRVSLVVLFQKKIYIIQPDGENMLCFDPADNSLTDDLPGCGLGWGFCASATDDFIYATGGKGTETLAMKYDPLTRKWEETAPMSKKRRWAAAATLDGKIYVIGGLYHGTSAEYYNPSSNSWMEISNMNARRSDFSACVVGGRLYAVGGDAEKKNGFYQHSIEVYEKNKWTVVTKFQTKDSWTFSCFWPHGSHQPGTTQPGKSYDRLESENLLETKKEEIGYAGRKVSLLEEIAVFEGEGPEDKEAVPLSTFKLNKDYFSGSAIATGGIPDDEVRELEFWYSSLRLDKKIGPLGGNLLLDESCSLAIRPNAVADTRNLSVAMSMDFQNLALPVDRIPISPYLHVKFGGKLLLPAKARVPTWFKASKDSEHAIKIYKRYRDKEDGFAWCELQNEVKVQDEIIEFEVDHFCYFVATIQNWLWGNGQIKLSHGLFQRKRNFLSVFCYHSPKSLFREVVADLKVAGFDEIHRDICLINTNQTVPIKMECFDEDLHKFVPQEYLLAPSDIKAKQIVRFRFVLQHLKEPKDEVDIRYIVDDFSAPIAVTLPAITATPAVGIHLIGDRATLNIGDVSVHTGDKGDVSTVINAPVGQLATGNANITNQGSGNNFVAGSQENTDCSVTAGTGQSTSSSVGENITINRSGA